MRYRSLLPFMGSDETLANQEFTMRRSLRQFIPSMFHRRLLLLGIFTLLIFCILFLRAVSLATGESKRIADAETQKSLQVMRIIPTVRGRIFDRNGNPIATDVAGFDAAVTYNLITGNWAIRQAQYATRDYIKYVADPKGFGLSQEEEIAIYNGQLARFELLLDQFWYDLSVFTGVPIEFIDEEKAAIKSTMQKRAGQNTYRAEMRLEKEWGEEVSWRDVEQELLEQTDGYPHTIFRNINDETQQLIREMNIEAEVARLAYREAKKTNAPDLLEKIREYEETSVWSRIMIQRPRQRSYPLETQDILLDRANLPSPIRSDEPRLVKISGVGLHFLGQMSRIDGVDMKNNRYKRDENPAGYRVGDLKGLYGIEKTMEDVLRGERGYMVKHLGKVVKEVPPKAGKDVNLSIDIYLQARIQALLSPEFGLLKVHEWHKFADKDRQPIGTPLAASVVVLDIETSEILAAVSAPNYSLEEYRDPERRREIARDQVQIPMRYRPVYQTYQPGSTLKPLIYVAGVTDGHIGSTEPIVCEGALDPKRPSVFRCWLFKQYMRSHGPLIGSQAIANSCNIYFYVLGRRMGVPRIADWLKKFGLGEKPGSLMTLESKGDVPRADRQYSEGDAINMGIGQGPVSWTPIQAAAAYAALARGGEYIAPTFVKPEDRQHKPQVTRDLNLNRAAVMGALDGLRRVITERHGNRITLADGSTEKIITHDDLDVAAKTGTADAPPQREPIYDEQGKLKGWGIR